MSNRSQRIGIVRIVGRRTRLVRIGDVGYGWLDWNEVVDAWGFRPIGEQHTVLFHAKSMRQLKALIRAWYEGLPPPAKGDGDDAA